MKIKTLYEGILSDMEDTLQVGDDVADSVWLNMEDSPMRKMFGRGNIDKEPFSIVTTDRKTIHCNAPGVIGVPFRIDGEQKLSSIISDVNEIVCIGGCTIMGNGNTAVTDKTLCDKITADIVNIEKVKKLDGVNMDVRSMREYAKYVPTIGTDDNIKEISNCHLDVIGNNSKLTLKSVPKFTNVSSNTINFIEMPLRTMGATDWNKIKFNELFEFDYELTIFDSKSSTTAKIKKMGDLNKLIASKDFYGRYYSDWPYRLKPGVKLCDIFDVSKFKKLKRVAVWGKTMGLIFENTKSGCDTADVFHAEMLKQYHMRCPEYHKTDFESNIPVTADGWRVFLVRL